MDSVMKKQMKAYLRFFFVFCFAAAGDYICVCVCVCARAVVGKFYPEQHHSDVT